MHESLEQYLSDSAWRKQVLPEKSMPTEKLGSFERKISAGASAWEKRIRR